MEQSWVSMVCAAALASFLGHFYRKWVTPEQNFYVINVLFGVPFVFCLVSYVLLAYFPDSSPTMALRDFFTSFND